MPISSAIPLSEVTDPDDPDSDYWITLLPGSTVEQLINVTVYSGKRPVTGGLLGTGMTAVSEDATYTLVVLGDLNGDGKVSITDVVAIQSGVLGKQTLEGAYAQAADLNGDGKVSILDVVKAARVVVGKDTIG